MNAADQGAGAPPPPPPPQQQQYAAPPPAASRPSSSVSPGDIAVIAGGVLMLIFSFLSWYKIEETSFFSGQDWSAWSNAFNLFPLATVVVVIGAALAAGTAAATFGGVALPDRVAGFTLPQLRVVAGVLGTLTLLAYLLRSFGEGGGLEKDIGLYVALIGSIALLVGAVMGQLGEPPEKEDGGGGGGQPSPATLVLIGAGVVILIGSFLTVASSDGDGTSAWGEFMFPLYTLPALLGVVVAIEAAMSEFTGVRLPGLLGMSWSQIRLACSGWALLMLICFLFGRVVVAEADVSKGIGFWIMLIAAIGLVAGSVMREQESGRPAPPPPAAAAPPPPPPPPPA